MIDTVKLRSPSLTQEVAVKVALGLKERNCIDLGTGEVEYCITAGSLLGSYDSRISVRIECEQWISDLQNNVVSKVECAPYLVVEGSIHKALMGHNVYGGPMDFQRSCEWLIKDIGRRLGVKLPPGSMWTVRKVDWSEVFDLGSDVAVAEYIESLNAAHYPRRNVHRYGSQAIYAPGDITTIKVYHKGPEYRRHDKARIAEKMNANDAEWLYDYAMKLCRIEVSIKARKLDIDYGGSPCVSAVTTPYLENAWSREVSRLLREGKSDMDIVRTHKEVRNRLYELYKAPKAAALFGTWMQLSALGDKNTREVMSKTSFYRHRNELEAAGCSWFGSDIVIRHTSIPVGFSPTLQDSRRLTEVATEVNLKMAGLLVA